MDNRLNYHTSTMPSLALPFSKVDYHTSLQSSRIALENLNRFNKKLDQNNVLTNAFLAQNPFISDEEREIFNKQMKQKALEEYEYYSQEVEKIKNKRYINGNICGNENSSSNITIS